MDRAIDPPGWMVVSEIELTYKTKINASQRPKISKSQDAYDLLRMHWDDNKIDFIEQFKILLLNRCNKVLGIYEASSGGRTGTVADPKIIFTAALKSASCQLILSHNHPSGEVNPSTEDKQLTGKLVEGAKLLDLRIVDHIILTRDQYFSFADEGLL